MRMEVLFRVYFVHRKQFLMKIQQSIEASLEKAVGSFLHILREIRVFDLACLWILFEVAGFFPETVSEPAYNRLPKEIVRL